MVTIVIPTRNEESNIKKLISTIWDMLIVYRPELKYDILLVDDSDDKTALIARSLGAKVIKGQHKGLGQAILDGIEAASGEIVLVMDADMSHNPKSIIDLLNPILEQGYDMTIGSRYVKHGKIIGWTAKRQMISRVASLMAYPLSGIKDSTSGFFAVRKSVLNGVKLRPDSWKIMLEIVVRANPTAVLEVPITFEDRQAGKSKFTSKEVYRYALHLFRLALFKYKAIIKFGIIGGSGALLHFLILYGLTEYTGLFYIYSAVIAILAASTCNYTLNHKITFKDRHISNHLVGWGKYQMMSLISDLIYLGLLALFTEILGFWYMVSAIISVLLIFPFKFVVASSLIWSKRINPSSEDYEWNAFHKGSLIQKWWKHQIAETVWEWIPKSNSILDYGCGSSPIVTRYGNKAVACDLNEAKLQYMKAKCPSVNYVNGTLKALNKQYDHAISIEVIEHLNQPRMMLSYLAEVVKVGGLIVIATPDYSRWWWYLAEIFTPYKEEHVYKFTREKLEVMCGMYGFQAVKHRYVAGCDLVELFEKVDKC